MIKKNLAAAIAVLLCIPLWMSAQTGPVNLEMVYKIKQEGFKNSGIEELSFWMTDYAGPRLTASDGKKRADEWTSNKMKEMGLQNVRVEVARPFNRGGWDNRKTYVAMTAPYYSSFAANPKAWTGSTNGLIRGEAVLLDIQDEAGFEKYKGTLNGKIILTPVTTGYEVSFEPLASRYSDEELEALEQAVISRGRRGGNVNMDERRRMMAVQRQLGTFLQEEGVAAIINGSGTFNVPRSTGANYNSGDAYPIPEVNLPVEAHGRMVRLINHDIKVEVELEVENKFSDSPNVTNIIGEIPGTDPKLKDEIVLIGGHLDSWHGGTGAADNASGCIVMMEAMRILKSLDVKPRRTIRIALWGGEEQGLNGSRGYAEKYLRDTEGNTLKGFDQFAVYFNMDNGTGKFRGVYLQENDMVRSIFESWLEPFEELGCSTLTSRTTGGTDHLSFDGMGLPAYQFIQDEIEYGRGYHTTMDTYERLIMDDLKYNAVIVASLVYNAAMREQVLPRKPQIESLQRSQQRRAF